MRSNSLTVEEGGTLRSLRLRALGGILNRHTVTMPGRTLKARIPIKPLPRSALPATALILLVSGCATVPRAGGFAGVRSLVAERTGRDARWVQGTPEDDEARRAVERLLEKPLDIDAVVQIALLNNAA